MNRLPRCRTLLLIVGVFALLVLLETVAQACPTCKDTLAHNDPNRQNLVRGYGYSIIFMLSMPFTIFTCMSAYFYYLVVKDRRLKAQAAKAAAPAEATPASALVGASH